MAMSLVALPSSPAFAASPAPPDSDETLLARYREGDEEAFSELYQRYRSRLYRFILGLSSNTPQADEVFQETWLAVIRNKNCTHFKPWLYQIARHRLMDCWRRNKSKVLEMSDETTENSPSILDENSAFAPQTPETLVLRAEQMQQISAALEMLPLQQREVFLLRAHADMALADIASLTETPLEAVKSRYRYAIAKLRQRLFHTSPPQPKLLEMEVKPL